MKNHLFASSIMFLTVLFSISLSSPAFAQKNKKKKKDKNKTEVKKDEKKKDKLETIEKATESHELMEGLFNIYQDSASGSLKMIIREDQIGKEYIHFYYFENGLLEARSFRGMFMGSKIFKIEKYFDRIDFIVRNTNFYIDPDNAIINSSGTNISEAVLFSAKIKAADSLKTQYLIEVDDLFLTDNLGFIKMPSTSEPNPKAFNMGSLNKEKTRYHKIKNYPENMDIVVDYVYENKDPKNFGSSAVTDARSIEVTVQHSIIAVPENDYEPRFDDPRVGYFLTEVNDLTALSQTPYRDMIHRWDLKKKDPDAELSEPEKPIVFWIENTTPVEIRPIVKKAAEQWNLAFEKAGFKNAVQVKQQPDTATWDAGDIRYNVLRWTSSPTPPFGGYGPSFVNPRTGQILGADIMLEYAVLRGNLFNEELFSKAGMIDFEEYYSLGFPEKYCSAGHLATLNQDFGKVANIAFDESDLENSKMINQFLHFLILHEIGHTLGLNHNMKSSNLHSLTDIHDENLTAKTGLTGSVMDYPAINYALDRDAQGQYWTTRPGPYDLWAIEYGYKPVSNQKELKDILARSTEHDLLFGNDADDMRSPGKAIDPRVNVNDMTSNPIDYGIQRMDLCNEVMNELIPKFTKEGQSYHELRNAYFNVTGQYWTSLSAISRFIGGVYVDRAFAGQERETMPFIPVEYEKQKKAMNTLSRYAFAPDAFQTSSEIYHYIQTQRRGFNFFSTTEDPKIHSRALQIQKNILSHVLHPVVLQRMVDSGLYGNSYSISQMMTDLNDAIFKADAYSTINSFRQNLQVEYVKNLVSIAKDENKYCTQARSMAYYNLNAIDKMMSSSTGDTQTRAHKSYIRLLIEQGLDED